MACGKLNGCPFYTDKMPIESGIGKMYKSRFCEGDHSKCARHKVSTELGKEFVPADLYPNMYERAEQIIKENK